MEEKVAMRAILLVKDDLQTREQLAALLRKAIECVVLEADHPDAAQAIMKVEQVGLLITDLFPPENKGLELQRATHQLTPETAIIVCVPEGAWAAGGEALRSGAFSIVKGPYDLSEVVIAAARGLQYHDMLVHREKQGPKLRKSEGYHGIIGESAPMRRLFDFVDKVAEDDCSTVLIQGETGTGKELVARAIHARGPRHGKNFVPVNCAAIPDDLLESELFGYVKGAFTGANVSKIGRVQYAHGGTLFLDEIGDMKPALQAKLLRVLQEKEYEPLGSVKPQAVDVRIVAATHRDLEKAVADGNFREDLFYRLSVLPLNIPPLRERKEDIPLLIAKFIAVFNRNRRSAFLGFEAKSLEALVDYAWPGNVRELENLVQRMAILHGGAMATRHDLPSKYAANARNLPALVDADETGPRPPAALFQPGVGVDFNALIEEYENSLIRQALETSGGNKKEAAILLGLNRTTLLEKIKKRRLHGHAPAAELSPPPGVVK